MDVFISWSGKLSYKIAGLLHQFLTDVIQSLKPFVSADDIAKGTVWPRELFEKLETSSVGVVCLTRENKAKPWILFEAGALAKAKSSRTMICTVLVDIEDTDIRPPLSLLQSTNLSKREDMLKLLNDLNTIEDPPILPKAKLERTFDRYWDNFLCDAKTAIASTDEAGVEPKSDRDKVIDEILITVRNTAIILGLPKVALPEAGLAEAGLAEAVLYKSPLDPEEVDEYEIIYPSEIEKRPMTPHRRTLRVMSDGEDIGTLSTKPYSPPVWLGSTDKATPRIADVIDRILLTGGIGAITPDNQRITWEDIKKTRHN